LSVLAKHEDEEAIREVARVNASLLGTTALEGLKAFADGLALAENMW